MQPNLDPNLFRRSYVNGSYPTLAICDGTPYLNSQFVDRLNRTVFPQNPSLYFCLFHSHDVRMPNDLSSLNQLHAQLLCDLQCYEYNLQFPQPSIVQFALKNESTLDKIFLMRVEEKIREISP